MSNYVYIPTEGNNLFTVGFYDPNGQFISDSDHTDRETAASRVVFLNGSGDGSERARLSAIIENTNSVLRSNQEEITMLRGHLQEAKRVNEELQGWKQEMLQLERTCNFNDLAKYLGAPIGVECRAWVKTNLPDIMECYKTELLELKRSRDDAGFTVRRLHERLDDVGVQREAHEGGEVRMMDCVERLNLFINEVRKVEDILKAAPELNLNNYTEEQVAELNEATVQASSLLAVMVGRTFNFVCECCHKPFTAKFRLTHPLCGDCLPF